MQQPDEKPLFSRGPSLGTRLFLLSVCSILLMVLDHQQGHLQTVRNALSVAVHPIRLVVDLPFTLFSWGAEALSERDGLLEENRRLRTALLVDRARLQRLATLEAENARLREMMGSSARVSDRLMVAEILAVDLDPYRHRLVINRGGNDAVHMGQAMLDAGGIVGQITRVGPVSSEAILISDPDHAIPVQLNRNGLRTIALGTGDVSRIALPYLANNADIQEGDLLVTSGLGGAFPAGYPVARVTRVEIRPGEPFAEVEAEPTAGLNREREVMLVWSSRQSPDAEELRAEAAEDSP